MTEQKPNVFAQMNEQNAQDSAVDNAISQAKNNPEPTLPPMSKPSSEALSIEDVSDVRPADKKKYVRPNLDGTQDVIEKFEIFPCDTTEAPELSMNKETEFYRVRCVITYASENDEGVANREYISGIRQFVQDDGSLSDHTAWYKGAGTQSAYLWELVASYKNKPPEELSFKEWYAFLQSKPKVVLTAKEYDNFGAKPGQPKKIYKNLPEKFL